jgi:hypothetical protein
LRSSPPPLQFVWKLMLLRRFQINYLALRLHIIQKVSKTSFDKKVELRTQWLKEASLAWSSCEKSPRLKHISFKSYGPCHDIFVKCHLHSST